MTDKYLLDTNIISELVRGSGERYEAVAAWLARTRKPLGISVITLYEVVSGLRAKGRINMERNFHRLIDELSIRIIDVNESIAHSAAIARAEFLKTGKVYQTEDLLIGMTAQRHGYILATANTKDFLSWAENIVNPLDA